ncbi:hypothetical protein BGZ68_010233 [Mortierella alpina]|nr:hypothetical protein BGZ68_010233 [Mortierella alpina]
MALTQGARTIRQPASPPSPWDTITFEEAQEDKCIPMSTLQQNSQRVRRLVFSGIVPSRYYNLTFSGLKEVCLQNIDLFLAEDEVGLDRNLQMFIFLNGTVERIDFENMPTLPGHNFWKAVFTHWRKLHELVVWSESSVNPESVEMFWRACTLPHSISFYKRVVIPRSNVLATMRFPCIRNLSMRFGSVDSKSMGPKDQLIFFQACTDLKTLSWKVHHYDLRELQLAKTLASGTWPKLEGLCFTGTTIPDDVLVSSVYKFHGSRALEYLCVSILKKPDADTSQDERVCQRIDKLSGLRFLDLRSPHRRPFTSPLPTEYKNRISLDPAVVMRFPRFAALKSDRALLV